MKLEEAIKIIQKAYSLLLQSKVNFNDISDYIAASDMAAKALEKQIPKKPIFCRTSGGQKGHMCPNCQRILTLGYPNYCEFCGQKLETKLP